MTTPPKQNFANATILSQSGPFSIAMLDQQHLPQIIGLHRAAIAALKDDEKAFMLLKKDSFFQNHFARANGNTVLGVICNDNLVGEAIVLHPSAKHPETGMTDMESVGDPGSITVLQGVTVLPTYRKNGLMHKMVEAWLNHAGGANKQHALAEVEVHNISSWSAFINQGMNIASIGKDPDDGALLYNLHETVPALAQKRLTQCFNQEAANTITCPIDDFQQQQGRLDNGFIISGWKSAAREFILTPKP